MSKPFHTKKQPKMHGPSERKLRAIAKRNVKASEYIKAGPKYKAGRQP